MAKSPKIFAMHGAFFEGEFILTDICVMVFLFVLQSFFFYLQMETKLRELQEKLAIEEADKLQLQTQLHQCLESEVIQAFLCSVRGKKHKKSGLFRLINCNFKRNCINA